MRVCEYGYNSPRTLCNWRLTMANLTSSTDVALGAAIEVPLVAPSGVASASVPPPSEVGALLQSLNEAAAAGGRSATPKRADNQEAKLVQARLGIASGLHTALRCKHAATAAHSLRVALGCSSWAAVLE